MNPHPNEIKRRQPCLAGSLQLPGLDCDSFRVALTLQRVNPSPRRKNKTQKHLPSLPPPPQFPSGSTPHCSTHASRCTNTASSSWLSCCFLPAATSAGFRSWMLLACDEKTSPLPLPPLPPFPPSPLPPFPFFPFPFPLPPCWLQKPLGILVAPSGTLQGIPVRAGGPQLPAPAKPSRGTPRKDPVLDLRCGRPRKPGVHGPQPCGGYGVYHMNMTKGAKTRVQGPTICAQSQAATNTFLSSQCGALRSRKLGNLETALL